MKHLVDKNFESSIEHLVNVIQNQDIMSNEASLVLPILGSEKIREIETKLAPLYQKINHLIVIGIGWSSLGAKAIMKFLGRKRKWYAELHFFETIDGDATYGRLHSIISSVASIEEIAICEISKSGGTLETKLLSEYIGSTLEKILKKKPSSYCYYWQMKSAWAVRSSIEWYCFSSWRNGRRKILSIFSCWTRSALSWRI
jgi:glucose-6-phosphate isomerase